MYCVYTWSNWYGYKRSKDKCADAKSEKQVPACCNLSPPPHKIYSLSNWSDNEIAEKKTWFKFTFVLRKFLFPTTCLALWKHSYYHTMIYRSSILSKVLPVIFVVFKIKLDHTCKSRVTHNLPSVIQLLFVSSFSCENLRVRTYGLF